MASPPTIDIAKLTAPIAGEAAVGTDLRETDAAKLYGLREACRTARRKESQFPVAEEVAEGEEATVLQIPDATPEWREVRSVAESIIANESKDVEVAAWLIEALVRLHGFAGLRDGFNLARNLFEQYGHECFPKGDDPQTVDPYALRGLNGEDGEGVLLVPIRNVPLTQGISSGPFAYWHYAQAVGGSGISIDVITRDASESDRGTLVNMAHDLAQAETEFAALSTVVDELCGGEALPTSNIRNQLAACREALKFFGIEPPLEPDAELEVEEAVEAAPTEVPQSSQAPAPNGAMTRDDAFKTIAELAQFFRKTEPHSPVSYALERIVRWGRMPLPQLLEELIQEDPVRNSFFHITGISGNPAGGGASGGPASGGDGEETPQ